MVEIPATKKFKMGSTAEDIRQYKVQLSSEWREEWAADEQPAHNVALDAYAIGRYPITYREFEQFVNDGGCTTKWKDCWPDGAWGWLLAGRHVPNDWDNPRFHKPNYPVVGVNWYEAVAYCNWLNSKLGPALAVSRRRKMQESFIGEALRYSTRNPQYGRFRLPTEAEWEYAARGRERRLWAWGNESLTDENVQRRCNAWVGENYVADTTPVGIYPLGATPNGIFDLAGNVSEWCADWHDNYTSAPERNPQGPSSGTRCVLRGGSWFYDPSVIRAAFRDWSYPDVRGDYVGFRGVALRFPR